MTTNLTIIEDALRDINVISEIDSASAEQGQFCLRRLNQMMEVWKEEDIDFGWFAQTSTTDTIPVPDWAELGVTATLAIACAPNYGASISAELAAIADVTVNAIKRKSLSEKLVNADMSFLPAGAGRGVRHNIITGV
jgi:hypothetical protein